MKVAMIDFHYDLISQQDGSVQKVIKAFAHNLNTNIACIGVANDGIYKEKTIDNVKYFSIPENKLKNKIANKILNLKVFTYDKMISILNEEKFDILHFHNRFELVDKLIKKLNYKPKVICHFHREFNNPIIPKNADLILGVSKALSEYIKQKTNTDKKIDYIHNPISYDVFNFEPQETKKIDKIKLLFAFGNNEKKGFKEVIETINLLEKEKIEYELNICGNKTPLNFSNKNIKVHGFLNHKKLYNLMKNTNILLFPSYSEGLPMTILEALYFGMFVIPSKVGGIPEIFGKEYNLYCELNPNSILEKIKMIKNFDTKDVQEYNNSRKKFLSKFSIQNLSKELEDKYKKV